MIFNYLTTDDIKLNQIDAEDPEVCRTCLWVVRRHFLPFFRLTSVIVLGKQFFYETTEADLSSFAEMGVEGRRYRILHGVKNKDEINTGNCN